MSGDADSFLVDPDDLMGIVEDMSRTGAKMRELLADLDKQLAALHGTWEGIAQVAMTEAQNEWRTGFNQMTTGLKGAEDAAERASQRYRSAATANTTMWDQL